MTKLSELFTIKYGVNLELISLEITNSGDGINFVSRTSENNGIVAKVKKIENINPQPSGTITVAGGGSVLSSFLQIEPFYSGRDLYVLYPKKEMTNNEKLFYVTCIRYNKFRYNYGRQANKTLKDIEVPDSIPDWVNKYDLNPSYLLSKKSRENTNNNLNFEKWKEYRIKDLFEKIERGKRLISIDRFPGKVKYFSASDNNNGLTDKIANPLFIEKDALIYTTFGDCYYVEGEFTASDEISILKNSMMNKYSGIFIATLLSKNKYKYMYGRKAFQNKFLDEFIKLPSRFDGKPDWEYMDNYIRSLPYSEFI